MVLIAWKTFLLLSILKSQYYLISSFVIIAEERLGSTWINQIKRIESTVVVSVVKTPATSEVSRRHAIISLPTIISSLSVWSGILSKSEAIDEQIQDSESFSSLAARAGRISKEVQGATQEATNTVSVSPSLATGKSFYDFSLPLKGVNVPVRDIIRDDVRAILVVNIKQDDPVARKAIPELISLAAKYGRGNASSLVIIATPTDQGYFEPDTSQLIRLKLESEYGYGINPSTILTDKMNLLGSGASPFWRWLESTCRTPAGIGRIEGNFEKFLIDGRTGLPVRRYPRKYRPLNIVDDIEALIAGTPVPPAKANWLEEWRSAAVEAERDTYRFEKGLNVFDQ
jgi:glutathione peroxidase-family protein